MPRRAAGQTQSAGSALEVLKRLPLQDRIRLTSHGIRISASEPSIKGDTIVATVHGRKRSFAPADIDTLWVKKGSYGLVGAAITGVPSAVLGAFAGASLATDRDSNGKPGSGPKGAIWGAFLLGVIGAIPGAIVGSVFPRWQRVYAHALPPG
ncbi:MAG: hypothetical protein H0W63_09520 [Gemmatimonadaceae bacterium]|nr:hypothetical protein [Gemmatimonadaceae bacterium]